VDSARRYDCRRGSLVTRNARSNIIGSEEAAGLTDIPNIIKKGTRLGLVDPGIGEELLAVTDLSTFKHGCTNGLRGHPFRKESQRHRMHAIAAESKYSPVKVIVRVSTDFLSAMQVRFL
jgi:hypothetical protein